MRISKVTEAEFRSVVARVSASYGENLIVHQDAHAYGNSGCTARVAVTDSRGEGARTSASGRHGPYACWHAYRDVLALLFTEHPRAIVRTGLEIYRGAYGFMGNYPATGYRNIGSMMSPAYMPDLCDCDGMFPGPWVAALEAAGPHPVILARTRAPRAEYTQAPRVMDWVTALEICPEDCEHNEIPGTGQSGGRTYENQLSTTPYDEHCGSPQTAPDTDALLDKISSLIDGDPWMPAHP